MNCRYKLSCRREFKEPNTFYFSEFRIVILYIHSVYTVISVDHTGSCSGTNWVFVYIRRSLTNVLSNDCHWLPTCFCIPYLTDKIKINMEPQPDTNQNIWIAWFNAFMTYAVIEEWTWSGSAWKWVYDMSISWLVVVFSWFSCVQIRQRLKVRCKWVSIKFSGLLCIHTFPDKFWIFFTFPYLRGFPALFVILPIF